MLDVEARASLHAALGEPARLAIVDDLLVSDRSPVELGRRLGMRSNLLARHLDVLEHVGLIMRSPSHRDGRRKYVRLVLPVLATVQLVKLPRPDRVLFVCTRNTARSPLAAGLWQQRTGGTAASAGLDPADRVHPGAVAAARRVGVDLTPVTPRHLDTVDDVSGAVQVITVCDSVHEAVDAAASWWHWSIADPVELGTRAAFDEAVAALLARIEPFTTGVVEP